MKIFGVIGLMIISWCFIVFAEDTDNSTTTATPAINSSNSTRFELPASFNKDFLNNLTTEQNVTEKFQTDEYSLDYQRIAGGDIHFTWKKGNDSVEMYFRLSDGNVGQNWNLTGGAVNISLIATSAGDKEQSWAFGNYQYFYKNLAKGGFSNRWIAKGIPFGSGIKTQDWESLEIFKNLINEWCDKNSFLVKERNKCVIY